MFPLDESYIQEFRAGDKEAFKKFFNGLNQTLLLYLTKSFDVNDLECEDLIAEAFYKVFKRIDSYRSIEHARRSIFVILKNLAIDHIRKVGIIKEYHERYEYFGDSLYEEISEKDKSSLMLELFEEIEKLPPQRKKILKLYFFNGKKTNEIASMINCSNAFVL